MVLLGLLRILFEEPAAGLACAFYGAGIGAVVSVGVAPVHDVDLRSALPAVAHVDRLTISDGFPAAGCLAWLRTEDVPTVRSLEQYAALDTVFFSLHDARIIHERA